MKEAYILALDQGTTSSRAILFDRRGKIVSKAQYGFPQIYPRPGWVEHDPHEIWDSQRRAMIEAVRAAHIDPREIGGIGITNQRETTILWDRRTGEPIYNAIVWQCRRTAPLCDLLKAQGVAQEIRQKTGLVIDAYFSGTKIKWILDAVPGSRERAARGELLCGTVDSWLIWNLTGGKTHVTDYSNASRTLLFDIHKLAWDEELCRMLDIPLCMLPTPVPSCGTYGTVDGGVDGLSDLGGIPICGSAGDQAAALFGQTCFAPGEAKNTYGTGCFTLMNLGETPVLSGAGLLTSVAWSLGGKTTYAMEGSVFNAGSTIQWLRDELGLISTASDCDRLAETVRDSGGVFVVPAFTGLGAPYWDMYARGTIVGLTRGTGRAHLARAVLEAIAFEVTDLMVAMRQDAPCDISCLRVDGGASVSDLLLQTQADLLRIPVDRPAMVESTAFGAAALAGLACGLWSDQEELKALRQPQHVFLPQREEAACRESYRQWKRAVERSAGWIEA
ncbi:MAG: glycerol kinase GlpK [Oscillospiraceae bacterium]